MTTALKLKQKISPEQLFTQLFQRAQFVFVGENHAVDDEIVLTRAAKTFKEIGVKQIAVEIPSNEQVAMDHYLESGDPKLFLLPFVQAMPAYFDFLATAKLQGLKVVCVGTSYGTKSQEERAARDRLLSDRIGQLQGKTLVLLGFEHVLMDSIPYKTTRTWLQEAGKKTAGVSLESQASANFLPDLYSAFLHFFSRDASVDKSFAYPTQALGAMVFHDPTFVIPYDEKKDGLSYRNALDAVIFLSPSDSPLNPTARPRVQK